MSKYNPPLWDAWCILSIIGIWPRYIEPNLILTKRLKMPIKRLPSGWNGAEVVQFSDLHLNPDVSDDYLKKLREKIMNPKPDLILFTGDFLCYSKIQDQERLVKFLQSLSAPYGCYAVYGNHDYSKFVSVNEKGEYDVVENNDSPISKGFERLFKTISVQGRITERAMGLAINHKLESLLNNTPFEVLHNRCVHVSRKGSTINLAGLGEYMNGNCLPEKAFIGWDTSNPGIVLSHNPDSVPMLSRYPGNLILCGHTHGGQINLPFLWRKFALMENEELKKGLCQYGNKTVYVNRGIGGIMRFRWFCPPEITRFTLVSQ